MGGQAEAPSEEAEEMILREPRQGRQVLEPVLLSRGVVEPFPGEKDPRVVPQGPGGGSGDAVADEEGPQAADQP